MTQKLKKEPVSSFNLDDIVFMDSVYNGMEPLKIVGVRKYEVELEGDYSGGTHPVIQKQWVSKMEPMFKWRAECDNSACRAGLLHNLQCDYPRCQPYVTNPKSYSNEQHN